MFIALIILAAITLLLTQPLLLLSILALLSVASLFEFFTAIGMAIFSSDLMLLLPLAYIGFPFLLSAKTRRGIAEIEKNYYGEFFKTIIVLGSISLIGLAGYSTHLLFEEFNYVFGAYKLSSALISVPLTIGLIIFIWLPFYLSVFFCYARIFKADVIGLDE